MARHSDNHVRYLLLRFYHYWDFPKGIVEALEDPFTAACREVQEETNITQLDFRWGKDYIETPPYNHGKVARYYLAQTEQVDVRLLINPEIGRPEHHEYRWMTYHKAHSALSPRLQPVLEWAQRKFTGS